MIPVHIDFLLYLCYNGPVCSRRSFDLLETHLESRGNRLALVSETIVLLSNANLLKRTVKRRKNAGAAEAV